MATNDTPRDRNVPPRKPVRQSRAANRPKAFFWVLGLIAIVGVAALAYVATKPKASSEVRDVADTTNAGPSQGYLIGKVDAPVQIKEFADFECPSCAGFATVTEPDVRSRIIEPGLANLTYYDFPITSLHRNTLAASNAAACADEQGKFWPMHDRLYQAQDEWNGEATDAPKAFFKRYAGEIGLDVAKWETCFDARKYQPRINANLADGLRRGVGSTPTFVIGNKLYAGMRSYDELKRIVDSIARVSPALAAATASTTKK